MVCLVVLVSNVRLPNLVCLGGRCDISRREILVMQVSLVSLVSVAILASLISLIILVSLVGVVILVILAGLVRLGSLGSLSTPWTLSFVVSLAILVSLIWLWLGRRSLNPNV